MKVKLPLDGTLKNTTLAMVLTVCAIAITAMVSHYPGRLEMKIGGPNGGQLTIDGRQPSDALK
jgi:hypothetical protein